MAIINNSDIKIQVGNYTEKRCFEELDLTALLEIHIGYLAPFSYART